VCSTPPSRDSTGGNQVKPSYTNAEIAQALNLPTMALMLRKGAFFVSMGKQSEAD
jgi:hypothetical protein